MVAAYHRTQRIASEQAATARRAILDREIANGQSEESRQSDLEARRRLRVWKLGRTRQATPRPRKETLEEYRARKERVVLKYETATTTPVASAPRKETPEEYRGKKERVAEKYGHK